MQMFMRPYTVPSKGVAVRAFGDQVNEEKSPMNMHPDDYELHYLGWFDEATGIFDYDAAESNRVLVRAKEVFVKK